LRIGKFGGALLAATVALLLTLVSISAGEAAGPGSSRTGYDISYPQCPANFPRDGAFGIVGVTNGLAYSVNPCLAAEYQWASARPMAPAFYMNTANPGPISSHWGKPGPLACPDRNAFTNDCAYNYGWNAALEAFAAAQNATSAAAARAWWLDDETVNSWNGTIEANQWAIKGYIDYLLTKVPSIGLYSTASQWQAITGGYSRPDLPNWIAGTSTKSASSYCGTAGFSGGPVRLAQYRAKGFDADYACP
jgi:hypothetical protein